ncbi:MAG TPA: helix-turn-helix transcriptional regulator [Actinomycetota bacterium]|nr:helix-turn-helix transcriptional regulator [Actinomycetota bacterium]
MATGRMKLGELGSFIREQRRGARLSLRKLSDLAGISNPYLSQIERGLRKPSAEILQAIAKALRISAETLYVRAGILEEDPDHDLVAGILKDASLTERQKQVLIDVYRSFSEGKEDEPEVPASKTPPRPKTSKVRKLDGNSERPSSPPTRRQVPAAHAPTGPDESPSSRHFSEAESLRPEVDISEGGDNHG